MDGNDLPDDYKLNDHYEQDEEEEEEEEGIIENIPNFPNSFFTLELKKTKSFRHHQYDLVDENSYIAKLQKNATSNANSTLGDIQIQLYALFESLLEEINGYYNPNDLVRVFITHQEMVNTNIIIGPDYLGNISTKVIMDQISDVIRSNNFIPADQNLAINVAAIRNLKGLNMHQISNISKDLIRKGCLISIQNEDELCLPRCLAVALAHYDMQQNPESRKYKRLYNTIRQNDRKKGSTKSTTSLQKCTALLYQRRAKIPRGKIGVISDVPAYEKALSAGITVISARCGNKRVHQGNSNYEKQILLYHTQDDTEIGHFSVLKRMNSLLGRSYYCENCDKGFNNNDRHKCKIWCNICGSNSCVWSDNVKCQNCHAICRSQECLNRHHEVSKRGHTSKCDLMLFCPDCNACLRSERRKGRTLQDHICGETFCRNCQKYYIDNHLCYMRSTPASSGRGEFSCKKFIFYDFESMQTNGGEHIPNLVVSHSICEHCCGTTFVTAESKCNTCGDRCSICRETNKSGTEFARKPCSGCGHREKIFKGINTVNMFCSWLIAEQHRNFTVMAHNARSYDSYFIYQYLLENSIVPQIIFRGSKIMYCHVDRGLNMRFLDSLNFLNMALSQVPKSFGLKELKKGYFPHLYNHEDIWDTPENLSLPCLPPKTFYDECNMSESRRRDFRKWYRTHRGDPFVMEKELLEYCRSDVNILLSGCWKFRELFMTSTGPENPVDPFDYTTIASVCMGVFRSKFLPEKWEILEKCNERFPCTHGYGCMCIWTEARKTHGDACLEIWDKATSQWKRAPENICRKRFVSSPVGLPPPHGYSRRDNFSKQSMEWIKWFENQNHVKVQHALSAEGEKHVVHSVRHGRKISYRLDGYFQDDAGREHALEFQGCWFHGCEKCYPRDRSTLVINGKSMNIRLAETKKKEEFLVEAGYTVHKIWSCEWETMKKLNKSIRDHVKSLELSDPIQIRDAYFGGRTNGIVLKKTMNHPEKGEYVDFCSLYPYVLKYCPYPIGHPTRIVENFQSIESQKCDRTCNYNRCLGWHWKIPYFGLMKAKVLPPRGLMFPILPVRINGKLMFPLCQRCTEAELQSPCTCDDQERYLIDTWTTVELEVAINMGYRIDQIYEVLHWSVKSGGRNEEGMFTHYINTFLRLKAEASGYPKSAETCDEKDQYIIDYKVNEGVQLEKGNIEPNPGLRSIAKLALNSFYGKFGQRTNMKKTLYTTSADQIYAFLTDYNKTIKDFHVLNENMVIIDYVKAKEFEETSPKTNVIIAAFCTSYARLKLWYVLDRLGQRVLYHDTDSVIFTHSPGQYEPPIGTFLGDLTDELTCKGVGCEGCLQGHWIVDFISCGAKNYAYKLNTGQVVCKVRGFSLNYAASKIINLEAMKKALECWKWGEHMYPMTTVKTMILRDRKTAVVYSKEMPKNYGVVYNKRVVDDSFNTLPYGY